MIEAEISIYEMKDGNQRNGKGWQIITLKAKIQTSKREKGKTLKKVNSI